MNKWEKLGLLPSFEYKFEKKSLKPSSLMKLYLKPRVLSAVALFLLIPLLRANKPSFLTLLCPKSIHSREQFVDRV